MKSINVIGSSLLTPFGDVNQTLYSLENYSSALSPIKSEFELKNDKAAIIDKKNFHLNENFSYSDKQSLLAFTVASDVISTTKLDCSTNSVGFVFATSYGHLLDQEQVEPMSQWAKECIKKLGISIEPIVVSTACSAGSDAVGIACSLLEENIYETVVIIAVDIVTEAKRIAHSALGTMTNNLIKPFDINRSGMLMGDGASALILSNKVDIKPEAKILGYGASNDASGLTTPDLSGKSVKLAIERALKASKQNANDIAVYYAHGTGTEFNDHVESLVVSTFFKDNNFLKIVGTKGALGHSLGACGLIELILLIKILNKRKLIPTVGLSDPIEIIKSNFENSNHSLLNTNIGISITLGFGGFNTALIVEAFD